MSHAPGGPIHRRTPAPRCRTRRWPRRLSLPSKPNALRERLRSRTAAVARPFRGRVLRQNPGSRRAGKKPGSPIGLARLPADRFVYCRRCARGKQFCGRVIYYGYNIQSVKSYRGSFLVSQAGLLLWQEATRGEEAKKRRGERRPGGGATAALEKRASTNRSRGFPDSSPPEMTRP